MKLKNENKKYSITMRGLTGGLVGLAILAGSATSSPADEIKLRVADSFPEHHYVSKQLIVPWMERVKELTNGKVAFEYFPAQALGKAKDLLDVAKNRVADIVYAAPLYLSDRLPLSSVVALPGVPGNATQKSEAYQKLVDSHLAKAEFAREGVTPLIAVTVAGYEFNFAGPKIESVDDLKGKKMRSSGGLQEKTVEALGGIPVQIAAPEVYAALQRGTVDGTITPLASVQPYAFDEVLKSITTNGDLGTFPITYVANGDVWNGLPEDVKTAMRKASLEVNTSFGNFVDKRTVTAEEELRAKGLEMYELPKSILDEFRKRTAPIAEDWASGLNDRGYPASDVLKAWKDLLN